MSSSTCSDLSSGSIEVDSDSDADLDELLPFKNMSAEDSQRLLGIHAHLMSCLLREDHKPLFESIWGKDFYSNFKHCDEYTLFPKGTVPVRVVMLLLNAMQKQEHVKAAKLFLYYINFVQVCPPIVWRIGFHILMACKAHAQLIKFYKVLNTMRISDKKNMLLQFMIYCLREKQFELAIEIRKNDGACYGFRTPESSKCNEMMMLYEGIAHYQIWKRVKDIQVKQEAFTASQDSFMSFNASQNFEENRNLEFARDCMDSLPALLEAWTSETADIYDEFVCSYVEIMESLHQVEDDASWLSKAKDVLVLYEKKCVFNPNANRYVFEFYERHFDTFVDSERCYWFSKLQFLTKCPDDPLVLISVRELMQKVRWEQVSKPLNCLLLCLRLVSKLLDYPHFMESIPAWHEMETVLIYLYRQSHDSKQTVAVIQYFVHKNTFLSFFDELQLKGVDEISSVESLSPGKDLPDIKKHVKSLLSVFLQQDLAGSHNEEFLQEHTQFDDLDVITS